MSGLVWIASSERKLHGLEQTVGEVLPPRSRMSAAAAAITFEQVLLHQINRPAVQRAQQALSIKISISVLLLR